MTTTTSSDIILASQSPRRADLLKKYGVDFFVYVPCVEELDWCDDLRELPRQNALLKAAKAAEFYPAKTVIAADTVIFFEQEILGKPRDAEDAFCMLQRLSGKLHEVISGCAVICREKDIEYSFSCISEVKFKELSDDIIRKYISKVNVLDKAGSYAIQEYGDDIIESFSGSLENIIGLPAVELLDELRKLDLYR